MKARNLIGAIQKASDQETVVEVLIGNKKYSVESVESKDNVKTLLCQEIKMKNKVEEEKEKTKTKEDE